MDPTRKHTRLLQAQRRERHAQLVAIFLTGMVAGMLFATVGRRPGGRGKS